MSDVAIRSCRNDIQLCSPEDQQARAALDRVIEQRGGKRPGPELTPHGEGYRAAKKGSRATEDGVRLATKLGHHAPGIAGDEAKTHAVKWIVEKFVSHPLGQAVGVLGHAREVVKAHRALVGHAEQQGTRELDGLQRDALTLFTLAGAGRALSEGFRAHLAGEAIPESKTLAYALVTNETARSAKGYERLMSRYEELARHGIAEAQRRGLTTRAELNRALASDRELGLRYDTVTAFRLGVDSVVYDASYAGTAQRKAGPR